MGDNLKEILILFGGKSHEHDISIASCKSISKQIDTSLFEVKYLYISKNNIWYKFYGNFGELKEEDWEEKNEEKAIFNIVEYLKHFDVVFPVLHGIYGEDGTLQGMLELFDIPYVGCTCAASAIGIDKSYTKQIAMSNNIPTLPFVTIDTNDYMIEQVSNKMDFPVIIKPAVEGSSIGITVANTIYELDQAIKTAGKQYSKVIIEPFIKGQELECAVMYTNGIFTSDVGEILPVNQFYDYEAKYKSDSIQTKIPANLPEEIKKQIQNYTKQLFTILGGKGFARIDFFYEAETKKVYLNEINTIPGFTNISMFPKLFEFSGIPYQDLITTLIESTIHP